MAVPIENTVPVLTCNLPDTENHGETMIKPISSTGTPSPSSAAIATAKKLVIPEGKVSILQRIFHFIKIIAAVALFAVGIAALICLQFGIVVSTPSLILMIAIMLVSFVVVIMAIQDSTPSQVARRMKQQIEQFDQENTRLHNEVDTLKATNAELTEQIEQLKQLHAKLSDFGNRLETHTGDFRTLVSEFKTSLDDFKSVGSKVETMLSPFEKLATSLQETFSTESIQQLVTTVTALRATLDGLNDLVKENTVILEQLKTDAKLREEHIQFLEKRKQELEAACSVLTASIADLRVSTTNLQAVEGRITSSIDQEGERVEILSIDTTATSLSSQDSSSRGQGGDRTDSGSQEDGQGGASQQGLGGSNITGYDEQGFPIRE
ncbi:hypothetical protein O1W69_04940 [Chlamydia sp. 12-01]|uniref:hypothetical protein n=1 Tax=Chlamydia sp. 12-01 TaxID=3002742 RepID=UPI0035D4FA34